MYIQVRLLKGFSAVLTYKVPKHLNNQNLIGKVIKVPIKNKISPALILYQSNTKPQSTTFQIREAIDLEQFPKDTKYYEFIKKLASFYFTTPIYFHQRIKSFLLKNKNEKEDETLNKITKIKISKKVKLTEEQQKITKHVQKFIENKSYNATLIYGVTASGKTEIYINLIIENFIRNKTTILLLPEVTLCIQFLNLLKKKLPEKIAIFSFHSSSNAIEKSKLWQSLIIEKPILIIGVHLPVMLPISNLGLIIVDEEHETGFQEKKHPKINSKEAALLRAHFYDIPIVLGSATPSLNSIYNVENNNWSFFQLKKRFVGGFPKIQLVLLNSKYKKNRKNFWISNELEEKIKDRIEKNEQIIIYINRRGFSFFVQCKKCGFIFQCPNCSVSLTLHNKAFIDKLVCHYCNYEKELTQNCPKCKTKQNDFLKKGIGTQQVTKILSNLFPKATVKRADMDTTTKKKNWQKTVTAFENGDIDILVGTQVITKGYHFPNVTLVGIVWADLNLHFPIFNAKEITLQKLIQVAGRAGRDQKQGTVLVQAMQEHEIFNFLDESKYLKFCGQELISRKIANYPPVTRLIQIEIKNTNATKLEKESIHIATLLKNINKIKKLNLKILGPSKPIIHKIQKMESRQIFIKSKTFKQVSILLRNINLKKFESSVFVVPTQ